MPDRTDHPTWPSPRGPWPEATDSNRIVDYGACWCINASGHPDTDHDYPDESRHCPFDECRTRSLFVDAVKDLAGEACDLEIYIAAPFQFGELYATAERQDRRVVFDCYCETGDTSSRFSVSLGDTVRIAMHMLAAVRLVDGT